MAKLRQKSFWKITSYLPPSWRPCGWSESNASWALQNPTFNL